MHVLLTNDDGPLDDQHCPYIKYLVDEINENTDWDLSIVVPNQQRSWIGKAHFAGKTLTTSYIYTKYSTGTDNPNLNDFIGPFKTRQNMDKEYQEWCLLDSTPAACADIGIHHLYAKKKSRPVDLVISGPNFGKNSGNLYILTSGTIGAAMEAVTHGVKAIALSYAFENLNHDYKVLKEAAKISLKLIKKLYKQLKVEPDIDIYSINIPLIDSLKLGQTEIHYAPILKNYWESIYAPVEQPTEHGEEQFEWKPDFKRVYKDGLADFQHTDSRVLLDEGISVTPLKAAFHFVEPFKGVITLSDEEEDEADDVVQKQDQQGGSAHEMTRKDEDISSKLSQLDISSNYLLITIPKSSYLYEPLVQAFQNINFKIVDDIQILEKLHDNPNLKVFHYGEYEDINLDLINNSQYFVPSYIYRKALIRKHYLANTIHHYTAKNPQSILKTSVPETYQLEVDYAEFLDDSLDDAYELRDEVESGTKTWILKPSMSDKGQGIRIFKTIDQLQAIFDSFEENDEDIDNQEYEEENNGVIISQLRHFVVQEYKDKPLLLKNYENKKFHLRTYVVCQGDLQVYVYKNILALFAESSYKRPQEGDEEEEKISMDGHLTNTCLQSKSPLVMPFWDLQDDLLTDGPKQKVFAQICSITGELFKAAKSVDKMNFQPLKNAIEIFGIDFLVNEDYSVTLLEVNSYPDFKQTGQDLKQIIYLLFEEIASNVVKPLIDASNSTSSTLVSVLSL